MTDHYVDQIRAYLDLHWSGRLDEMDRSCLAAGLSLQLADPGDAPCDHCVIIDGLCRPCGEPRTHAARMGR